MLLPEFRVAVVLLSQALFQAGEQQSSQQEEELAKHAEACAIAKKVWTHPLMAVVTFVFPVDCNTS
jgi:hypothetical protein